MPPTDHRYPLIIFDWDGTLMDSEQIIVRCMQHAIEDMGLSPREDEEVSNIIGLGLVEAVEKLYPGENLDFAHTLADHYRNHFFNEELGPQDLFPGVRDQLQRLQEEGHKLAVATGKSRRGLDQSLQQCQLEGFFDSSRCADETRSKPHPQMVEEILAELDIPPTQAVMVGDTEYDLEMAQRAGIDSIAVCYGVHAAERLQRFRPLACIDTITAISDIIRG